MRSTIRDIASEMNPIEGRLIDLQGDIAVHLSRTLSARGITQRQLATLTGMTEPRISKILTGEENLTLRTIVRLELATGVQLINAGIAGDNSAQVRPGDCATQPLIPKPPIRKNRRTKHPR